MSAPQEPERVTTDLVTRIEEALKGITPEPWCWRGVYLMQDVPARDGGGGREDNPYSTPCGHPIASDGSAGGEYAPSIDTNGPDARLIASAPQLLRDAAREIATLQQQVGAFIRRLDAEIERCNKAEAERSTLLRERETLRELVEKWRAEAQDALDKWPRGAILPSKKVRQCADELAAALAPRTQP